MWPNPGVEGIIVTTAWRIEVLDTDCYRFLNVSGQPADQVRIEDSQREEPIEVPGPVDYVLGNHSYSFDQVLVAGEYLLSWHPADVSPEARQGVSFTVPLAGSGVTALLGAAALAGGCGGDDRGADERQDVAPAVVADVSPGDQQSGGGRGEEQ
jgi:hypothetical protein